MQRKNAVIFYHEDFYRQVELVPEENYFSAGKYINERYHDSPTKYGIYNITSRPEQHVRLTERKIPVKEMSEFLDPISLTFSDNVTTGYGNDVNKAMNTIVWGFEQYGLFVKYEQTVVEAIWLTDSPEFPHLRTPKRLTRAIFETSKRYSLILIDWNKEILCRINSEGIVKEYLSQNYSFNYF